MSANLFVQLLCPLLQVLLALWRWQVIRMNRSLSHLLAPFTTQPNLPSYTTYRVRLVCLRMLRPSTPRLVCLLRIVHRVRRRVRVGRLLGDLVGDAWVRASANVNKCRRASASASVLASVAE
jgi:hypothetical protein